ncbi:Glycosyl transferase family 2 [Sphingomonas sp. OV641]|uniref:glycosyltransferase family 2 protein n=1 Tax=Sphingomonas sp. OV641 TaxID=1881068 RepID=UPI0008BF74FE|nr:glycosyltransferase family A protein [Sphingomonas sp. OV641]SEJ42683.1 Glycosyl transferase family 2 [Sphingomonas sp. OV641]
MKISVVIPTHRRSELLSRAISSVTAQVRPADEIIIVDDADDSASRMVVEQAAATGSVPIRYVRNTSSPGACGSRNLGAFVSTGDWVAFLDDDDDWTPDFLEQLARPASAGTPLVLSGLVRHEAGHAPVVRASPEGLTAATVLAHRSSMTGSNFLIRSDLFCAVRGFDPYMTVFNDWDLFIRLIKHGASYAVVPLPLAHWREHPGERIATPSLRRADGLSRFLARHGCGLPHAMRRELRTTMLGIRRAHVDARWRYLELSVALALAHGPRESLSRLRGRRAALA